jgi:hypothetical protein
LCSFCCYFSESKTSLFPRVVNIFCFVSAQLKLNEIVGYLARLRFYQWIVQGKWIRTENFPCIRLRETALVGCACLSMMSTVAIQAACSCLLMTFFLDWMLWSFLVWSWILAFDLKLNFALQCDTVRFLEEQSFHKLKKWRTISCHLPLRCWLVLSISPQSLVPC